MNSFLSMCAALSCSVASAQTLNYTWPNQPCATVLNCDSGCTACALPTGGTAVLMGIAPSWLGVDACPHPVAVADNAVATYNWPGTLDPAHQVMLSGLAFSGLSIDSVIIRHTAAPDGPSRVHVRFGANTTMPTTVVCDVPAQQSTVETIMTDLGVVQAEEGSPYGFFQLILQAYDGGLGAWAIDDIRIVTSPATATSVAEVAPLSQRNVSASQVDLLGRAILRSASPMITTAGRRVVVLQ
ncbi:MAG: hypothetical protein IPJ76_17250 [Flavobacteriales bacterium]|nr:MAG: hypothetical protein IPJ76_17250 [Flavobacteriales bacterium]